MYQQFLLQEHKKFTQIGIFGFTIWQPWCPIVGETGAKTFKLSLKTV
jgi:hypothetical protein